MKMSDACRKRILEPSEGLRLTAYRDCVGVLTIGYGHTTAAGAPAVYPGMTITAAQADQILADDLGKFETGVSSLLKRTPLQRQFDAVIDLPFNIGLGNFRSSSLLRYFNAGNMTAAANAFLSWNRAGGRVISGLTHRRALERSWVLGDAIGEPVGLLDAFGLDMPHGFHDAPDNVLVRADNRFLLPSA